jgi:hypothetical protein
MQKSRIIKYIEDFGSITPLEAMRDIGCYRLSARIYDLKEDGYNIVTKTVGVKNRYDEVVHVAQYSLESQE